MALTVVLLCWTADAEEQPAMDSMPQNGPDRIAAAESNITQTENELDLWHARISHAIVASIDRVDRFFADDSLDDESHRSRIYASLGLKYDERDDAALYSDIKMRLAFPRTNHRLQLFIDETITADETGEPASIFEAVNETRPDAGFRFVFSRDERKSVSTDIGARLNDPAQLFGRLRGRFSLPLNRWQLRLSQTLTWFTEDGWTETSEMRWNRPLDHGFLFRSLSRLTWEEEVNGVTPSQSFILFKELSARRGFNIKVSGVWPETPDIQAAKYTAMLTYRQLIYRRWLFLEVSPGIDFPQAYDYRTNGFITALFEVVFSLE